MASNFRLFSHRNRDSLHLQMYGDFDGNSAHEVINTLKKYGDEHEQIFIDTNDLANIHPFGITVFHRNFDTFVRKYHNLIFLGRHRHSFLNQSFR